LTRLRKGDVAIVTGASSGIGKAVAAALAAAGARVVINYHSGDTQSDECVTAIREAGGDAVAIQADISREDHVEHLLAETLKAYGRLDIMVANAGIQRDAAFVDMTLDQWNAVIGVNLTGQFLCCRAAVRQFLKQDDPGEGKARGRIICMSSVHQHIPWSGHVNYASAKGGVKLLMESLALEVAEQRIRVNAIAPGAIKTPINHDAWATQDARDKLLTLIPYGRIGRPEDIGRAAVWLASDESDYVTGATLVIDGGMSLYPGFRDNG
jgi:glucose 1-dehydrogenase